MTNVSRPAGLSVSYHGSGGLPNRFQRYHIASGLASNIFRGDAVVPTATSKNVARPGAADDRLVGVFDGCFYVQADGQPTFNSYWPSGTTVLAGSTAECNVYDDPNTLFEIQGDEDLVLADIGALADLTIGTGNAATGVSGDMLDSSTIGSGAVFKIEDYARRPENELATNYTKVIVSISKHYRAGAKTGI